jgi:predicted RNase H-like HicB family nuclease
MPAVSAQAKTIEKVNSLLDDMVHKYLEVVKETKQNK